jgi:hypothetical protein
MSEYSYERYEKLVEGLLRNSVEEHDPDDAVIGENISPYPEVKIIFDGFGYNSETDEENGDTNTESYAVFVHQNSGEDSFEFPEHEMTPWCLIHRPNEEVCIYTWLDISKDFWEIIPVETCTTGPSFETIMDILEKLNSKYSIIDNGE